MPEQLISIIVPVHNVEKYLHKCVDSIINQSYKNLEIILVDDGSSDSCRKDCEKYAHKDERVRVIHKEHSGPSDARNAGVKIARGEYIGFVDSDDYIDERMYEVLYTRLKSDGSDMAICGFLRVDENGILLQEQNTDISDRVITAEELLSSFRTPEYWRYILVWNKLYKRELFSEVSFPVGKLHEDEFIAHRIIGMCKTVSCLSEPLYYYVRRSGSIMNTGYSIEKLSAAEAFIDRARYMRDIGMDNAAGFSLMCAIRGLRKGYLKLWKNDSEAREKIKTLSVQASELYSRKTVKTLSVKDKLQFIIFKINPFFYYCIASAYSRLRGRTS